MLKKNKYFKEVTFDVLVYGCSIIIPKISLFFLIPILTRVLTPSVYGYIDLLSNLSGILGVLLISGMDHSYAYQYNKAKTNKEKTILERQLFGNRIIQVSLLSIICLITSFVFNMSGLFGHISYGVILIVIIATAIIFACGFNKMHVSNFNLFISIIFISVAILIFLILKTSKQKN